MRVRERRSEILSPYIKFEILRRERLKVGFGILVVMERFGVLIEKKKKMEEGRG